RALAFGDASAEDSNQVLAFPGKLLADEADGRLFVADTGHHRIIEVSLPDGRIQRVFGSGARGWTDGDAADARFDSPEGLALADPFLYVADTENHVIRRIDLNENVVTTIAGT